jgi:hypothetical protein
MTAVTLLTKERVGPPIRFQVLFLLLMLVLDTPSYMKLAAFISNLTDDMNAHHLRDSNCSQDQNV